MSDDLTTEQYWAEAWQRHLETYLGGPPRAGYWLEQRFGKDGSVLELAGGSCRDSRWLADRGADAIGSDFDEKTLDYLRDRFPQSSLKLRREDSFALSLDDKSVDLSFSNGFWICFDDDERLLKLMREQARVTRKWMIALVHNRGNDRLLRKFARLSKQDSLYDVRFFSPDELTRLIDASGIAYKSISYEKFGGPADVLFNRRPKGIWNPFARIARRVSPRLYRLQPWRRTERIACIVELV